MKAETDEAIRKSEQLFVEHELEAENVGVS